MVRASTTQDYLAARLANDAALLPIPRKIGIVRPWLISARWRLSVILPWPRIKNYLVAKATTIEDELCVSALISGAELVDDAHCAGKLRIDSPTSVGLRETDYGGRVQAAR